MKVCVISTTIMVCPPKGYSGLEMLAWQQADGLSKLGNEVLLIAPIGSTPPPGTTLHGTTLGESEQQAFSGYHQKLPNYDVIIDNSWQKWSYISKMDGKLKSPVLGVCHAPCNTMYQTAPPIPKPCFVSISKDQAAHAKECWNIDTRVAYNGVDTDFYSFKNNKRNGRYLFLARFSRIKGPHIAVALAKKLKFKLDLVGDDKITGEPEYAKQIVADATHNIYYYGSKDRDKCAEFFNNNEYMLHMNKEFREPFGLAPVEAQLCGMPVIAFDNGAMRETINHGKTGFLVKSEQEVEDLIVSDALKAIDRTECRQWAEQFSITNMHKRYLELCNEALNTGGW
jgi:glycosyltransferase involved in cell wall biosynthesis